MRTFVKIALSTIVPFASLVLGAGMATSGKTRFESVATLSAPAEAVFGEFADLGGWGDWCYLPDGTRVEKVEFLSDKKEGLGATRRLFLTRGRAQWEEVVVAFERPRRIVFGPTPEMDRTLHAWRWEIELAPAGAGTQVRWTTSYEARGPVVRLVNRLYMARTMKEFTDQALANLGEKLGRSSRAAPAPSAPAPGAITAVP